MKTTFILNGRTTVGFVREGVEEYLSRLRHYLPIETIVLPEVKSVKGLTPSVQMEKEADLTLKHIAPTDHVVLLDEHGKEFRSVELADWLNKRLARNRNLVFVVGGPFGFSRRMKDRADELLSISRLTFSHQMIRLLFLEQLYRACTILKGEPYHHE